MDSINRNQPEEHRADLEAGAAIRRIQDVVEQAQTCFFVTAVAQGDSQGVRPMSVREVDDEGNLWFLSANDSHKNAELALDPTVQLFFQGSPHADFLALTGTATVTTDRARIHELWSPFIQTWFTEGKDDPRITAIKVTPSLGYYWDNKHGTAVAGAKMLLGALLRKTLDDSIEGTVRV